MGDKETSIAGTLKFLRHYLQYMQRRAYARLIIFLSAEREREREREREERERESVRERERERRA